MFLQVPAYPATANEAYVYLPLAFGFLQWELLVTKATAVLLTDVFAPAHSSNPECRQHLRAVWVLSNVPAVLVLQVCRCYPCNPKGSRRAVLAATGRSRTGTC